MRLSTFAAPLKAAVRLAATVVALAGLSAEAAAAPAMWKAEDADSRVYMLGTIHMLDPTVDWMTDLVETAFAQSDALWLELDFQNDPTAGFASIARLGTSPDRSLLSRLTPKERADLTAGAEKVGVSVASMQGMRPWLASMMLGLAVARKAGLTEAGVDLALLRQAAGAGTPVHAFETGAEQLALFADLSEADELQMLRATIATLDQAVPLMRAMSAAWADGRVDDLLGLADADMKAAGAAFQERLLVRRNERFADRIAEIMKGSGTTFVAVGAAHFAGEDSVIADLAKAGITVERIQ